MPEQTYTYDELDAKTVEELKPIAAELNISGRSSMDKEALINAILDPSTHGGDDAADDAAETPSDSAPAEVDPFLKRVTGGIDPSSGADLGTPGISPSS